MQSAAECESSGGVGPERQCGDENENWFRFGKTFFFLCDSPLGAVCLLSARLTMLVNRHSRTNDGTRRRPPLKPPRPGNNKQMYSARTQAHGGSIVYHQGTRDA